MKSHKHISTIILATAMAAGMCACSEKEEHGLRGTINGAKEGTYAILETTDQFGLWYCVDSAKVSGSGEFFIPFEAPKSPEIYRLRYADNYLYMPIDSVIDLTLKTDASHFNKGFTLSGSKLADNFTAFERDAQRVEAIANPDSTEALKMRTYNKYIATGRGDILSYYILTRSFGGGHLIEYTDPLYSAVATSFQAHRPNDPHTAALVERAKQGQTERRKAKGQRNVIEAQQIAMIDMEFADMQGRKHKLSDVAGKGKPTILAFTAMSAEDTPALNRSLRSIYDEGRANIYEVCYDADHLIISNASKGLPWVVVQDPAGAKSRILLQYNVSELPTMFIYDSRGELQQRASNTDELRRMLQSIN